MTSETRINAVASGEAIDGGFFADAADTVATLRCRCEYHDCMMRAVKDADADKASAELIADCNKLSAYMSRLVAKYAPALPR